MVALFLDKRNGTVTGGSVSVEKQVLSVSVAKFMRKIFNSFPFSYLDYSRFLGKKILFRELLTYKYPYIKFFPQFSGNILFTGVLIALTDRIHYHLKIDCLDGRPFHIQLCCLAGRGDCHFSKLRNFL